MAGPDPPPPRDQPRSDATDKSESGEPNTGPATQDPDRKKTVEPITVQTIALDGIVDRERIGTTAVEKIREERAADLAQGILEVFRFSVWGLLAGGFVTVLATFACSGYTPENVQIVVSQGLVPLLEKTASFASTVFGPLLAFVLGYYFGERRREGNAPGRRPDS